MANIGGRFGPFHLEQVLGEGGQSVVWAAIDVRSGQRVALKLLRPGFASDKDVARLKREAALLNSFSDPGLPRGFELHDEGPGGIGLSMELVHGRSLAAIAAERTLDAKTILIVVTEVARILSHIHSRGLVHRDIKPGNIQLREGFSTTPGGNVVLVDFGIAKGSTSHATKYTATGASIGTVAFMAPELLLGSASPHAEPACDVYSLGVVMWSLLLGDHPAGVPVDTTMSQLVLAHARAQTAALDKARVAALDAIAPGLGAVVSGCVQPNPANRFRDGCVVHQALSALKHVPLTTPRVIAKTEPEMPAAAWIPSSGTTSEPFTQYTPSVAQSYGAQSGYSSRLATSPVQPQQPKSNRTILAVLAVGGGAVGLAVVAGAAIALASYDGEIFSSEVPPAVEVGDTSETESTPAGTSELYDEMERLREARRVAEADKRRAEAEAAEAKRRADAEAEARRREAEAAEAARSRRVSVTFQLTVSARKPNGKAWDALDGPPDPSISGNVRGTSATFSHFARDEQVVSHSFAVDMLGKDTISFNVMDKDIEDHDTIGAFTFDYAGHAATLSRESNGSRMTVSFSD